MPAKIIDGKKIAKYYRDSIRQEVVQLKQDGIVPGLAVILAGDNPASKTYVRMKRKACEEMGIHSVMVEYGQDVTQNELLEKIHATKQ